MVRHGETIWHAENRYTGRTDVPLTELGHEQARLLAGWAKTAGLSACWSSTLARARTTVAPAAEAAGLQARHDARLCEIDFGDGEGRTASEMRELFGDRYPAFQDDPYTNFLPGGEAPSAAVRRATSCLAEIAEAHPDGRVLVVWHSTLMRLTLCRLLGIPGADYRRTFPFVRNVGITELRNTGEQWSLLQYNSPIDR
ncbi:histidine phosphatase family protein [Amycolatopsis sp. NPDC058340]|uniref:histidine phosphatase family protein n=1 Tax=Amycolatopsis sp. NPDC058340 TaxID=3346453 RepID=UPI00364B313B